MTNTGLTLLVSTALLAFFHASIPGHWLPFSLLGTTRNIPPRKIVFYSGFAACLHSTVSAILGFIAWWIGKEMAHQIGESMEKASAMFVLLFGVIYLFLFLKDKNHHHHIKNNDISIKAITISIGLSPCVLLMPNLLASPQEPIFVRVFMVAEFYIISIFVMVVFSVFGQKTIKRINTSFLEKFGDPMTGIIFIVTGLLIFLHG